MYTVYLNNNNPLHTPNQPGHIGKKAVKAEHNDCMDGRLTCQKIGCQNLN